MCEWMCSGGWALWVFLVIIQKHVFIKLLMYHLIVKRTRLKLDTIWMSCVWSLWKFRNSIIFNYSGLDVTFLLEKVKLTSWTWIKTRDINFNYNFNSHASIFFFFFIYMGFYDVYLWCFLIWGEWFENCILYLLIFSVSYTMN